MPSFHCYLHPFIQLCICLQLTCTTSLGVRGEMTEESSTTSHVLSVAMTTTGVTNITGKNTVTSSSSRGVEVYFYCAVLVIGVVGTATNALILYALVASKQHKKHVLIVHQNVLDLVTSFFMVIIYSVKHCDIYLTGSAGYWQCTLILSESLIWWGSVGSVINLAIITIERYLKVLHPAVWSNVKLRNRVIYSAMAFAWIASFISNVVVVFPTSAVVDGACYAYAIWRNGTARFIYYIYKFVFFYVIILFVFIFCYWRILNVIRRQTKVTASHIAAVPSTAQAQTQSHQIQSIVVIKTMIFVSAFYAIAWLPIYVYLLLLILNQNPALFGGGYYVSISIAFLYMCTNPFIYATKFDPVRKVLLRLIP